MSSVQTIQPPSKEAISHEQEIRNRVAEEKKARAAKPPVMPGSIVMVATPASRETGGQSLVVPAVVIAQDEDTGDLNLSCFHLGGLFHMRGVNPVDVDVVIAPNSGVGLARLADVDNLMERVSALEDLLTKKK
jgi:hypothetical protein